MVPFAEALRWLRAGIWKRRDKFCRKMLWVGICHHQPMGNQTDCCVTEDYITTNKKTRPTLKMWAVLVSALENIFSRSERWKFYKYLLHNVGLGVSAPMRALIWRSLIFSALWNRIYLYIGGGLLLFSSSWKLIRELCKTQMLLFKKLAVHNQQDCAATVEISICCVKDRSANYSQRPACSRRTRLDS